MDIGIALPALFAAIAVTIAINWLKKKAHEYNPIGSSLATGTIEPHKGVAYFTLLIGIILFGISIFATFYGIEMLIYGSICALMSASIIIFTIPSLTSIQDVNWTNESINGPTKVTFQIMGFPRREMKWTEIVKIGLVKGPYYYVANKDDDRIYWSRSYKNFQNFEATLKQKHPTLIWPQFEIWPESNDT